MSWFDKILPPGLKRSNSTSRAKQVPEGLWVKCPACDAVLYSTELEKNLNVCPKCEHHMRLRARLRLERLLDTENRKELGQDVRPVDALKFKDSRKYTDRLSQAASASGETDALVVMEGTLEGLPVVAACFEFDFMGGSMGSVVGFAFLGDVVIAEPNALVGFAGPRVIEQTVREKLPPGFQRAEFLLEKGAIDMIVHRRDMRQTLADLAALLQKQPPVVREPKIEPPPEPAPTPAPAPAA